MQRSRRLTPSTKLPAPLKSTVARRTALKVSSATVYVYIHVYVYTYTRLLPCVLVTYEDIDIDYWLIFTNYISRYLRRPTRLLWRPRSLFRTPDGVCVSESVCARTHARVQIKYRRAHTLSLTHIHAHTLSHKQSGGDRRATIWWNGTDTHTIHIRRDIDAQRKTHIQTGGDRRATIWWNGAGVQSVHGPEVERRLTLP